MGLDQDQVTHALQSLDTQSRGLKKEELFPGSQSKRGSQEAGDAEDADMRTSQLDTQDEPFSLHRETFFPDSSTAHA